MRLTLTSLECPSGTFFYKAERAKQAVVITTEVPPGAANYNLQFYIRPNIEKKSKGSYSQSRNEFFP